MNCEFEGCKAEAKFRLGLADPDARGSFYCRGHCDEMKQELTMKLFGVGADGCKATTWTGKACSNSKLYGDYCGIHKYMNEDEKKAKALQDLKKKRNQMNEAIDKMEKEE